MNTWLPLVISAVVVPLVGILTSVLSVRLASRDAHKRIKADWNCWT